ncbi:hypothetical protein F4V57_02850 [Acinetobacter qingfengensis]|uniref:Factor H binding protein-like C-terminal domain-containing protein n=1 Tax=Acinetobacter qingfengensis TaxID=1262585 RepID=A0A1E7R8B2_9GAMM|nr:factor H binding protein domain-containing protein [Acinetobacter qingfengensis]KAA8734719.1 hypothetical protein F4V57_02850 [Acinetobacter qingfengensis]OEY95541.1 hypothetical protein BJI46_12765 [Acinetobacter qingfengensis]
MKISKTTALLLAALASSVAMADDPTWTAPTVDFSEAGATDDYGYTGSFVLDNIVYGPGSEAEHPATAGNNNYDGDTSAITAPTETTLDLESLPKYTVIGGNTRGTYNSDSTAVTAYRIYVQDYSAIVANNTRSTTTGFVDGDSYTKAIYGLSDPAGSIAAIQAAGSYTYNGVLITPSGDPGDFNYTITAAGSTLTGSGTASFTYAGVGTFNLTLASATLSTTDGLLGVTNGNVTVAELSGLTAKYDLGVYGDAAQEVAGNIHTWSVNYGLTDLPIIGKR